MADTVHTWDEPCSCCAGTGKILRVDGLDLRRLRESHDVSLGSFAERVRRPGRKAEGVTVAFVSEVERGNKNCPEWLYKEYLRIPSVRYRKKRDIPAGLRQVVKASKVKAKRGVRSTDRTPAFQAEDAGSTPARPTKAKRRKS